MRLGLLVLLVPFGAASCTINTTPGEGSSGAEARVDASLWYDVDGAPSPYVDAGPWRDVDGGGRPAYVDAGYGPEVDGGYWGEVDAGYWPGEDAGRPPPYVDAGTWPSPDAGYWPGEDAGPSPGVDGGTNTDCASIDDEAVCTVTPECVAVYEGVNCVCFPDGTCRCESWAFSACE